MIEEARSTSRICKVQHNVVTYHLLFKFTMGSRDSSNKSYSQSSLTPSKDKRGKPVIKISAWVELHIKEANEWEKFENKCLRAVTRRCNKEDDVISTPENKPFENV